jgi:hypothetical protein
MEDYQCLFLRADHMVAGLRVNQQLRTMEHVFSCPVPGYAMPIIPGSALQIHLADQLRHVAVDRLPNNAPIESATPWTSGVGTGMMRNSQHPGLVRRAVECNMPPLDSFRFKLCLTLPLRKTQRSNLANPVVLFEEPGPIRACYSLQLCPDSLAFTSCSV